MPEPPARREQLLERVVDVILADGVAHLSLRPLAAKTGTSARLLIYHFGSKEVLISEALERVRQRMTEALRSLRVRSQITSPAEFLRQGWRWATSKESEPYFRLLYEIDGIGAREKRRAGGFGIEMWVEFFDAEFRTLAGRSPGGAAQSTLVLAVLNGLIKDYLATGDRKRTTAALELFIGGLEGASR